MHLRAPMASLKRFVASHVEKLVHPSTRATDTGAEGVDNVLLGTYERLWSVRESEGTPFVTRGYTPVLVLLRIQKAALSGASVSVAQPTHQP